ncbi:hypothetical protein SODALDRAFT_355522 [Sodiomyces alkalinus F11]|uniref:Uncharacterized protein n=1 Tax=Sodiomyces alkalinus (strain CBS 110278 / VKM F-3762 / F11) TaxID=1314773 RepID=A0A3N2Q977_SODAK|nr:hypothetical protein SODALDRAFT_355522 [Sodiomyces alkalinus F11]ROT43314.1 hypothetical protein SODALDRAFT_355522 [Sodiomyces alkalinus F11]
MGGPADGYNVMGPVEGVWLWSTYLSKWKNIEFCLPDLPTSRQPLIDRQPVFQVPKFYVCRDQTPPSTSSLTPYRTHCKHGTGNAASCFSRSTCLSAGFHPTSTGPWQCEVLSIPALRDRCLMQETNPIICVANDVVWTHSSRMTPARGANQYVNADTDTQTQAQNTYHPRQL